MGDLYPCGKTSEARDLLEGMFTLLTSAEPGMLEIFTGIQSKVTTTVPALWQHKHLSFKKGKKKKRNKVKPSDKTHMIFVRNLEAHCSL